jgi:phospholipid transport system substrate-binding protein
LQGESQKNVRYRLAREAIVPRFDFDEMAKRSLGPHWLRLNFEERRIFVGVLTRFQERIYIANISAYQGVRFPYADERVSDDFAEVVRKVISPGRKGLTVRYMLRLIV